jgi:hypothetical protein
MYFVRLLNSEIMSNIHYNNQQYLNSNDRSNKDREKTKRIISNNLLDKLIEYIFHNNSIVEYYLNYFVITKSSYYLTRIVNKRIYEEK